MRTEIDLLLNAAMDLIRDVHPDRVEKLAAIISDLDGRKKVTTLLSDLAEHRGTKAKIETLLILGDACNLRGAEVAALLLGANHAYHSAKAEESAQLVWTGPATEFVATRKTEQVLLELIGSAGKELFITSFVAYRLDSVLDALSKALERGVEVSILLESSDQHGGSISIDSIGRMESLLPEARIYY